MLRYFCDFINFAAAKFFLVENRACFVPSNETCKLSRVSKPGGSCAILLHGGFYKAFVSRFDQSVITACSRHSMLQARQHDFGIMILTFSVQKMLLVFEHCMFYMQICTVGIIWIKSRGTAGNCLGGTCMLKNHCLELCIHQWELQT